MENEKSMEAKLNEAQKREADKKLEIKRTVLFVLFVFVVTYGTEIFMVMPLVGSADTDQAMAAQTILSSVMFIPTFGAILIRWITKERLTVTNLMLSLKIKENLKYYGLAWLGTAGVFFFLPFIRRHFSYSFITLETKNKKLSILGYSEISKNIFSR